jgi:4-amino-4-deoxy-L-arabinose transferase-like glycosyltransferase
MKTSTRHQVLLAAIAAALFFFNLGQAHLWDVDEAIFSQAGKEMFERGDYVTPYFNGQVFPDKPALMYWFMIGAYEMFGPTEFAARFWSAVFGVGSVLLTYRLGRLMFSPAVGFWAGLVLATNLNFTVIARAATPDSFLTFFTALAVLVFVSGTAKARALSGDANERNAPWAGQTRFEPTWLCYALLYAVMGLAVLTKGPIGVVLPTAILGMFLLAMRAEPVRWSDAAGWRTRLLNLGRWLACVFSPHLFVRTVWSMRPLTAIAVVLAVAGPWYVWVGIETGGAWTKGFFGVHNFGRFLNAMENHRGPIYYYLIAVCIGFFPWSVLFGPSLWTMGRQLRDNSPWRAGYVLVCCWLAVWIGFFSLAGTKLPSYVVPAYPALALLMGAFVERWLREPALLTKLWPRLAWGIVAVVGVGMIVALPIVAHLYLDDQWFLGAIGLVPLTAAIVGLVFCQRDLVRPSLWTMAALGGALTVLLFSVAVGYVDPLQDSPLLAREIAARTPNGRPAPVASFHHFRPSLVFYVEQPIAKYESPAEVEKFFAEHPGSAFMLTTDSQLETLRSALPRDISVLATHRRFLRPGSVVLLGRASEEPATAARTGAPLRSRQ